MCNFFGAICRNSPCVLGGASGEKHCEAIIFLIPVSDGIPAVGFKKIILFYFSIRNKNNYIKIENSLKKGKLLRNIYRDPLLKLAT